MAAWVKQYSLDGIDVDYEDFNAFDAGDGSAENWLISFTKQLRSQLPQGTYILTHAPVAPWFSPNKWGGGGYLKIHQSVGSMIDWYNVQFYNQGVNEYTTCDNLLTTSSNTWPQSSLFQISNNGVPLNKLVIGKPATSGDAGSGFISTSILATCVQQAKNKGWNGGVMVWEYPRAASPWITSVRSLSWPVLRDGSKLGLDSADMDAYLSRASFVQLTHRGAYWSYRLSYVAPFNALILEERRKVTTMMKWSKKMILTAVTSLKTEQNRGKSPEKGALAVSLKCRHQRHEIFDLSPMSYCAWTEGTMWAYSAFASFCRDYQAESTQQIIVAVSRISYRYSGERVFNRLRRNEDNSEGITPHSWYTQSKRHPIMFGFKRIGAILAGLSSLLAVAAIPLENHNLTDTARSFLITRAAPSAPRWVIYSDKWVSGETGPPAVSDIKGYNVFALSFLLLEGAYDQAEEWTTLTAAQRSDIKSQYSAAGISLIVSLFGSTDAPTSTGADPIAAANTMAAWVKQYDLDGVDVDYEDFNAINAGDGKAEAWLVSFTQQLRTQLLQGTYILTHAPVAPWFSPGKFGGGAYLTVNSKVGSLIDCSTTGTSEYTDCNGLLTTSSSTWPQSALFQIAASGVPLQKLVIGKPATSGDANNGYMSTSALAQCVEQAKSKGWSAGVMVWEFPDASASWIESVRSLAFPE
ncbi:hypothetical protein NP233_g11533 [Leucocoprinus birnbaumii]|uniref:chitinase n=1 Tax=Leucocoprinus birnbaumii TaxID=56174 RepID=A0AAD5VMB4_9AGAR|nr:hypothetical protein NP233_g11533 [Leucocoprinus birnbaumii]